MSQIIQGLTPMFETLMRSERWTKARDQALLNVMARHCACGMSRTDTKSCRTRRPEQTARTEWTIDQADLVDLMGRSATTTVLFKSMKRARDRALFHASKMALVQIVMVSLFNFRCWMSWP